MVLEPSIEDFFFTMAGGDISFPGGMTCMYDNDIAPLFDKAMLFLSIGDQGAGFRTDILRIDISGPDQPHLAIIDLPGLFRAGNKEQNAMDTQVVQSLVRSYMENPRSLILAEVSAWCSSPASSYRLKTDRLPTA